MRAALWHGNGRHVEVDDVNLPAPGPHEVVVDTTAVVACITDVIAFGAARSTLGDIVKRAAATAGCSTASSRPIACRPPSATWT